jgi:hypothetical protein
MRRFLPLSVAAAALATVAIAIWGLGIADRLAAASKHRPPPAVGSPHASEAIRPSASRPTPVAAPRYRAEACSGDYVCGDGGAWESGTGPSAESWTLTSDGF